MTRRTHLLVAVASVYCLAALEAQAPLSVSAAWVREPVPGRLQAAAYAVIENPNAADERIVSILADVAGAVEMHEMVRTGDMMKMAPVRGITVPAKGKVELKPGGLHVMLFELKKPLQEGDRVSLAFTTATGARLDVVALVKKGPM